jgi:hypothetical protein
MTFLCSYSVHIHPVWQASPCIILCNNKLCIFETFTSTRPSYWSGRWRWNMSQYPVSSRYSIIYCLTGVGRYIYACRTVVTWRPYIWAISTAQFFEEAIIHGVIEDQRVSRLSMWGWHLHLFIQQGCTSRKNNVPGLFNPFSYTKKISRSGALTFLVKAASGEIWYIWSKLRSFTT